MHVLLAAALLARPAARPVPRASGVYNDLGSGSNVDLCVITPAGVEYLRNYEALAGKTYSRVYPVKYPPGTAREPRQLVHASSCVLCCCAR